jgi:hypothetical protein
MNFKFLTFLCLAVVVVVAVVKPSAAAEDEKDVEEGD